jgi:hypothetical protein
MEHDWLRPESQWNLRTLITLALLCALPLGLTVVLFTTGNH